MAKKTLGAAALAAALISGGALGAVFGAPVVSAAQDEATTVVPAASDDGTTTTGPSDSSTDDAASNDAKNCTDSDGHSDGRGARFGNLSAAADALGVTNEELREALRDGSSIADVARERGVDKQTVIDAMVSAANANIDERVAAGELDNAKADEIKAATAERVTALVDRSFDNSGKGMSGHRRGR